MSNPPSNSVVSNSGSAPGKAVNFLLLAALITLLIGSVMEFYDIASGTGRWYAATSPKWFAALVLFCGACLAVFMVCAVGRWRRSCVRVLLDARARFDRFRAPLVVILILLPIVILQYTLWGAVLREPYLRVLLSAASALAVAWLLSDEGASVVTAKSLFAAALLSGSTIVIAAAFTSVTSYPFSLGWSEGNRLWDYSLLFGTGLYSFDPRNPPVAYLDIGRQLIGGLPFLFPPRFHRGRKGMVGGGGDLAQHAARVLGVFPKETKSIQGLDPGEPVCFGFPEPGTHPCTASDLHDPCAPSLAIAYSVGRDSAFSRGLLCRKQPLHMDVCARNVFRDAGTWRSRIAGLAPAP